MGVIVLDGMEALGRRDAAALTLLGNEVLARVAENGAKSSVVWGYAFIAAAAHVTGEAADPAVTAAIDIPLDQLRGFGVDDILVYLAAEEQIMRGDLSAAADTLCDYFTHHRLSRSPVWIELRRLAANNGLPEPIRISTRQPRV